MFPATAISSIGPLLRRSAYVLGFASALAISGPTRSVADTNDAGAQTQGIVACGDELLRRHNPDIATSTDRLVCFAAYISHFNTGVRGSAAHDSRVLGIPHWTVQQVEGWDPRESPPEARGRPRSWFTVPDLQKLGVAPTDASYRFSARFRAQHRNWYERGHLAQKYLAERLGGEAGWFTHNLANAVPQRARFNKGPWYELECYTGAWANEFGSLWIVTGPVFLNEYPTEWLESDVNATALPVAIPDALFKIVARKRKPIANAGIEASWDVLAFIYPQEDPSYERKGPWGLQRRLVSIARIEELTHQQFFPALDASERDLKTHKASAIWPAKREHFDPSCRRFASSANGGTL